MRGLQGIYSDKEKDEDANGLVSERRGVQYV